MHAVLFGYAYQRTLKKAWQDCEFFIIIFALIATGTTMNYFLDDKINKAEILFPGVGCFLIAVCLASAVHTSNAADNKEKLNSLSSDIAGTEYAPFLHSYKWNYADLESFFSFIDISMA
jgi:hypothetical protein